MFQLLKRSLKGGIKMNLHYKLEHEPNDLIGKVAKLTHKSFEEVAYSIPLPKQVELLVNELESKKTVNQLCEEAYQTAKSKGWHDRPRKTVEALALVHCEVSEAIESDRRREGKDRVAEELADVCIRVFDLAAEMGFDLEKAILDKMEHNKTREHMHGGKAY